MKFLSVSLALFSAQQALAAEQGSARAVSEVEAVDYLRSHPYALPKNSEFCFFVLFCFAKLLAIFYVTTNAP
jgi:hypothetical protein